MAIMAGMTAIRYYYNVCSSPDNQLELVMEGIQVIFAAYFHCVCNHAVVGLLERQSSPSKKRDERLQLQGGDGASKGIQPSVSSPDMETLTVVVTGRGCQTRPPRAPPSDGLPLELREARQDGSACHS